jgi:hypothetical protein
MTTPTTPTAGPGPTVLGDGEAVRRACRDIGLADAVAEQLLARLLAEAPKAEPVTSREAQMMVLLKTPTPERLVHDLRNVLNELVLLKAAADL